MERNIELLEQTMCHINDHPTQHDQSTWVQPYDCGTIACFAGWAALLSGMTSREILNVNMRIKGAELLGLTEDEAHTLFDTINTRPVLELMVKDLVNGYVLGDPDAYFEQAEE